MMPRLQVVTLAIFCASGLAAPEVSAQSWFQPWLGIDPDMTPSHCTQPVGGRCALICPASDGQKGYVEGTDIYSNYSSICAAAIHAGVLPRGQAGVVVIVIADSPRSFRGSERNRVTSVDRGARSGAFTFATDGAPGSVSWQTAWSHVPADFTGPVTVSCPPGGDAAGKVWGTDVYTVDSMICVAAAHAGLITPENGGAVTVQRAAGLRQYAGTERFGIASRAAAANPDAFAVTAARTSAPQRPPAEPAAPAPAIRMINVAGFTAVGSAPGSAALAPRIIQAAAWIAVGTAPAGSIGPRTIQTAAWTAVGSAP